MNLFLNGEPATAPDRATVAAFVVSLGLPRKESRWSATGRSCRNLTYSGTALADGDRIEIVQFVGGG